MHRKMKKGFSLIELLVVLTLIGILASIILARLGKFEEKSALTGGIEFDAKALQTIGDHLVGEWLFDDPGAATNNIAYDSSGAGHNGTVNGGAATTTGYNGKVGYRVDGSNDYVNASVIVSPSITVSAWVKSYTTNWNQDGWIACGRFANGFIIHPNINTKNVGFYVLNSTSNYALLGTITVNNIALWHHYAFTFDYTTQAFSLYLDGEKKVSGTYAGTRTTTTGTVYFGYDNCCGRYGNGYIDDMRIYSKALLSSDIQELYAKEKENYVN